MDERLPNNASSVSVIGLCRVVFVDSNNRRVDDGHANIIPTLKHRQQTGKNVVRFITRNVLFALGMYFSK